MSMQFKDSKIESTFDRIIASCQAGIISSVISLPFDNEKLNFRRQNVQKMVQCHIQV
ncbi:unnamed protein product [Paramecium sonneborni]|uniref:Uncharacterized protein n=1 Tax=Paramecium sonneborni TaxID=65129 RepID=A0A8S1MFA5_9CILI|nr:unnamed protein product [Paramecium sonneborni]